MEFNQLEYLVTVAEEKTILKAAEKLNISQPALTRSIQNLEKEFGFPLFDRVKNRLVLNEMGTLAVQQAKDILSDREKMIQSLTNLNNRKRKISIGSCAPAPLWGVVHLLSKQYSPENINYEINEDNASLLERFQNHAYRFLILDYPVNHNHLISKPFLEEQLYLAVKKDQRFSDYTKLSFSELNGTTIMSVANEEYFRHFAHIPL